MTGQAPASQTIIKTKQFNTYETVQHFPFRKRNAIRKAKRNLSRRKR